MSVLLFSIALKVWLESAKKNLADLYISNW